MSGKSKVKPPDASPLKLRVRSIAHGWIAGVMAADGAETELLLDDVTDPVFELAEWAQAVQAGAEAALQFRRSPWTRFLAEPGPADHHRLRIWDDKDPERPVMDLYLPSQVLAGAVRCFLEEVEQHSCLASSWVCFMDLSDAQYDYLGDEADELWERCVREGQRPDNGHQQKDFEARYVAARVELTTEQTNAVEDYKDRLRAAIQRLRSG